MTSYSPNPVVTFAGNQVYSDNTIASISINSGRTSITEQPAAGWCKVELWTTADEPIAVQLSQSVQIDIDNGTTGTHSIFFGTISDIDIELADYGSTSSLAIYSITAVGPLAQLNKRTAGAAGYSKEYDGTRIYNILSDAFLTSWDDIGDTVTWNDLPVDLTWENWDAVNEALVDGLATNIDVPGQFELQSYTDGETDAWTLASNAAQSGRGVLYENHDGSIGYDDYAARLDYTPITLTSDDILAKGLRTSAQWSEIVNDVSVTYKSGTKTARDEQSVTLYGQLSGTRETQLENHADAQSQADNFLSSRAYPRVYPEQFIIPLHSPSIDDTKRDELIHMHSGTPIITDDLPAVFGTVFEGYVEGWNWKLTRYEAFLTLVCSAQSETYPSATWYQLGGTTTWNDIPGTTQWKDL